ncbi:MAG: MBL fold metallo-hydrolase [Candidatus Aenigmarchaeota archaeon]|nr:MBL fold metallo-hydrolase [Candidatus Aenigmarchaeota archaeon]
MNKIKFLGIGAGDISMVLQMVPTSSIFCELDGIKFLIDPGPGTLINARRHKIDITELNGLLVSHLHTDHAGDANAVLSGMNKNSFLIAEKHCLKPSEKYYPAISRYHQEIPEAVFAVEPEGKVIIGSLNFEITPTKHYDPAVGFKIIGSKTIGYVGDGIYFNGQEKYFAGCDLMIFNTLVMHSDKPNETLQMSINDATELVEKCKPKLGVIQHYSYQMIRNDPIEQARIIQDKTGVRIHAAMDGTEIEL